MADAGYLLVFIPVLVMSACGGGGESASRPGPVPLAEKDTAFVAVSGGTFVTTYGDTVEIGDFRLGRFEVSNRFYLFLADEAGLDLPPDPEFTGMRDYLYGFPDHPVVNVSMNEALEAASVIGGRLPTRAEWQYAASLDLTGDIRGKYPWGSLDPADAEYPANYLAGDNWETRGADGYLWTAPVDAYPLTDAGFAALAGNVSEWTMALNDSVAPVCGGSWLSPSDDLTVDAAKHLAPGDRARHIGFRILLPGT